MFPEFIKDLFQEVEGQNSGQEVYIFTLSTCMWCKKAKRWLIDRGIKYRYVDVDKIEPSEKSKVLTYLREKSYVRRTLRGAVWQEQKKQ